MDNKKRKSKAQLPQLPKPIVNAMPIEEAPKEEKKEISTFKSYNVKISTPAVNRREGPGYEYPVTFIIRDQNEYTILEEKDGWGRIGKDWVCLEFVHKVN